MKLEKNIGTADRLLRIIFSIIFIVLFMLNIISGPIAVALLVFSAISVITAFAGFCPLYRIIQMDTRNFHTR